MEQGSVGGDGAGGIERGRRRRDPNTAPPFWFGIPFLGIGLLVLVLGIAVWTGQAPDVQSEAPPWVLVAIGGIFALVGAALLATSIRARRHAPQTGPDAAATVAAPSGSLKTDHFTRSPMRVLVDLVMAPLFGVAFLGMAVFVLLNTPIGFLLAWVPAFFGVLLLAGAAVSVRRGLGLRLAEVGPAGIWTRDMGRLAWSEVEELRIEDSRGVTSRRDSSAVAIYRRLGIVPKDPTRAERAPGRAALALARWFVRLMNSLRPAAALSDPTALAPFGLNAYELEQPFDRLVASVERYMPVSASAVVPAAPALVSGLGSVLAGPSLGTSILSGLPAIEEGSTATGSSTEVEMPDDGESGGAPVDQPSRSFRRRSGLIPLGALGMVGDLGSAIPWLLLPSIFLVVFPVVTFASGEPLSPAIIVAVPFLFIPLGFLVYGIGQVLQIPIRRRFREGDPELLVVDADGIDMRGMGRLGWAEIAQVRAVNSGRPTSEGAPNIPRLEIVPRDLRRVADLPRADRWYESYRNVIRRLNPFDDGRPSDPAFRLDFDLLAASPDEVLDLIARYTLVDDRT